MVKPTITCNLCNIHTFHMLVRLGYVVVQYCGQFVGEVWRWRGVKGCCGGNLGLADTVTPFMEHRHGC